MRWLIINTDYGDYIHWLYERYPGLQYRSYGEQHQKRMESLFGVADFYSGNLKRLGFDAWDVIANIRPMQEAWAAENNVSLDAGSQIGFRLRGGFVPWIGKEPDTKWLYQTLEAQVKSFRPDVLYSMAVETVGSEFLRSVRGYYRIAVGQSAAPLPTHDISEYDLMLSSLPNQVAFFLSNGFKSELFRLGFEPKVLDALQQGQKRYDCVFVGSLGNAHQSGTRTISTLCSNHAIDVWGYGLNSLPRKSSIRDRYRGTAWGIDMYQILNDARIVLNRHVDIAANFANNMRLYETTGVGTMLITDMKSNLHEIFDVGKEVVAFSNTDECLEFIRYYLDNSTERESIARAGQERTLKEHNYNCRMKELAEIVGKYF